MLRTSENADADGNAGSPTDSTSIALPDAGEVLPGEPVCVWYSVYVPVLLEPVLDGRGLGSPCGDRYTYSTTNTGEVPELHLCLSYTGSSAVEKLATYCPDGWEDAVFEAAGIGAFLDDATFSRSAFDACLAEQAWASDEANRRHSWNLWDSAATNYTPACSSAPRRKVMGMALWLIVSMRNGVPATYQGFDDVRSSIISPIRDTEMSYFLYAPGDPLTLLHLSAGAVTDQCTGVAQQFLVSAPGRACDPSTQTACGCLESAGVDATLQTAFDCANSKTIIDLRGSYGAFQFGFVPTSDGKEVSTSDNHADTKETKRVWLCTTKLDRCAVMYDWYLALAAAHLAATHSDGIDATTQAQHLLATNFALRMALSVAADLAADLVHETAHNLGTWHCANAGGRQMGCVQDAVSYTWLAYATARLGLPGVYNNFGAGFFSLVNWSWTLGLNQWSEQILSRPGQTIEHALGPDGTYTLLGHSCDVECQQGQLISDEEAATGREVTEIGAVIGAAAFALGEVTGSIPLIATGVALLTLDAAAGFILTDYLTDGISPATFATIQFTIDTPLTPGGNVTNCRIFNRNVAGVECAPENSGPCWETSPPAGLNDCTWEGPSPCTP